MAKKFLTYEELMALAKENYCKGGDRTYECLAEDAFEELGPMTKADALRMFKRDYEIDREYRLAAKYYGGEW